MMRSLFAATLVLALAPFASAQTSPKPLSQKAQDKVLRINQLQVIGTHNSYNMGFAPSEDIYMNKHYASTARGVEYHHQDLPHQLEAGIRQLELDIVQDPKGGRFSHPKIVELTKAEGLPADPDFDPNHEMDKPGFKIIHLGDLNLRSGCNLFTTCLKQIRTWSKAHPKHAPIFLLIEDKQGNLGPLPGHTPAEPWTAETWDSLDREILSVFPRKEIITPDDVRGKHATLEESVLANGWPTLGESRGKVLFLLYIRKSAPAYLAGHPMMQGRVLFVNGRPGEPEAGFVEQDAANADAINDLVKKNYLVRTRSDTNTNQGRNNDTTRRDMLLASGAQIISTDFPVAESAPWPGGYNVGFPEAVPARCNPINAPTGCNTAAIEPGVHTLPMSPTHLVAPDPNANQRRRPQ